MTTTTTEGRGEVQKRESGQPWPIREAAAYLNVSEWTLKRAGDAGKLRVIRIARFLYVPDAEMVRVCTEGM